MELHRLKFGELCLVTTEMTGLICVSDTSRPKTGVYSGIALDILDQFSQSFHHMKALYVPMMDLYPIFQFVKGRCYGNQIVLQ